jgi:hypothetical protein
MRTEAMCCPLFTLYEGYNGSNFSSVGKWAVLSAVIFDWGRVHTAAVISVSSELYDNQVLSINRALVLQT